MAVMLAGCFGDSSEADDAESSAAGEVDATAWTEVCAAGALAGRLYAVAGADRADQPLVEVQLCPLEVREVSHELPFQRVASNGAVTAVVVKGHDIFDHPDSPRTLAASSLGMIVDDRLETDLRGVGKSRAFNVAVADDGMVAIKRPNEPDEEITLETWDPDTGEHEVVYSGPDLRVFDWGPDGALAVAEPIGDGDGPYTVTVIDAEGAETVHRPGMSVGALSWGAQNLMALSPRPIEEPGVILDMGSGEDVAVIPAGWWPRAWSPDGETLLLLRPDGALGYLHPGDDEVRELGFLPAGPVPSVAWID